MLERRIAYAEADGHKLRVKYYKWKYNKLRKRLAKLLRKKAGIKDVKKKKRRSYVKKKK